MVEDILHIVAYILVLCRNPNIWTLEEVKMNKKKVCALTIILLLTISLIGCGEEPVKRKSKDKTVEKETQIASEEDNEEKPQKEGKKGFGNEKPDLENKICVEYDEEENCILVYDKPTEEILNADFSDFKFQLNDTVFSIWPGMTVKELMDQLPEYCQLKHSIDEVVSLDEHMVDNDGITEKWEYFVFGANDIYDQFFELRVANFGDEPCCVGDCIITLFDVNYDLTVANTMSGEDVVVGDYDSFTRYHFGNIIYLPKGIPMNDCLLANDNQYSEENLETTLVNLGLRRVSYEDLKKSYLKFELEEEGSFFFTDDSLSDVGKVVNIYMKNTFATSDMNDSLKKYYDFYGDIVSYFEIILTIEEEGYKGPFVCMQLSYSVVAN